MFWIRGDYGGREVEIILACPAWPNILHQMMHLDKSSLIPEYEDTTFISTRAHYEG